MAEENELDSMCGVSDEELTGTDFDEKQGEYL